MLLGPLPIEGENLHIEPLFREPLILVAPPDHPLASRDHLTLSDLAGLPVLSLDRRHHLHRDVVRQCQQHDMNLLRDYEGTSLDSVRQMVASGLGLAILPELYVRSELARGGDVALLNVELDGDPQYRGRLAHQCRLFQRICSDCRKNCRRSPRLDGRLTGGDPCRFPSGRMILTGLSDIHDH